MAELPGCQADNPSELRKFVAPEFIFGPGARELVGRYAAHLGARHVLLVTDPGVQGAGWAGEAVKSLGEAGVRCSVFAGVSPNPRVREVMAGADLYRALDCDGLVAVGGGSVVDCAKGIGVSISSGRFVAEFEGVDRVETTLPPLLCIPTTGAAADVSQFAIFTLAAEHRKIAVVSKALVPDLSLVDPVCCLTMPKALTAGTAIDALSHAIEAYVSTGHSPITDLHALEAIRLIGSQLRQVVAHPDDIAARSLMAQGSLQAGLAFSNASLGAVHAMSHVLGGRLDVPHGECNAMLLEHVITFNFPAASARYRCIAATLGVAVDGKDDDAAAIALCAGLRQLRQEVGLTRTLSDFGVTREALPGFATDALRDICMVTNPRRPTQRDLEEIYERAL